MGSTYLQVRTSGFFYFQELQKVDKTVFPSFIISQFIPYMAVMDVQIVGDEDPGLSITTSWSRRCNKAVWEAVRSGQVLSLCPVLYCPYLMFLCELWCLF